MRHLIGLLCGLLGAATMAAETSLICEYGDKEETRLLRFDESAGTLRYKGDLWVDRSKRNEHTDDGWTLPTKVTFSPTEIKATFRTCTSINAFGMYIGCNTEQVYTLDRTTGTFTAEAVKRLGRDLDIAIMQCRLVSTAPIF